jgi:hypothetical protein
LGSEAEAEAVFVAIKAASGADDCISPISFEEFTRSIIYFPQLLRQFKEDFEAPSPIKQNRKNLSLKIDEEPEIENSDCDSSRTKPYIGYLTFETQFREINDCDDQDKLSDIDEILKVAVKVASRSHEPSSIDKEPRGSSDDETLSQRIEASLTTLQGRVVQDHEACKL